MDNHLPTRFEQIESVFERSRTELRHLAVRDGLSAEEGAAYENHLRCWFHGFARRPGNDQRQPEALWEELLSAAHEHAAEFRRFFRQLKALQTKAQTSPPTPVQPSRDSQRQDDALNSPMGDM
jgi:hypothetical protein